MARIAAGDLAGLKLAMLTPETTTINLTDSTYTLEQPDNFWYGPTGPTRGTARVFIDGRYAKTVDLRRSSFSAHVAVYSGSWATAGRHTIKIEVVGTSTHPMVAIDEFVVKS